MGAVADERVELIGGGRLADQVEVDATDELDVGGRGRDLDLRIILGQVIVDQSIELGGGQGWRGDGPGRTLHRDRDWPALILLGLDGGLELAEGLGEFAGILLRELRSLPCGRLRGLIGIGFRRLGRGVRIRSGLGHLARRCRSRREHAPPCLLGLEGDRPPGRSADNSQGHEQAKPDPRRAASADRSILCPRLDHWIVPHSTVPVAMRDPRTSATDPFHPRIQLWPSAIRIFYLIEPRIKSRVPPGWVVSGIASSTDDCCARVHSLVASLKILITDHLGKDELRGLDPARPAAIPTCVHRSDSIVASPAV